MNCVLGDTEKKPNKHKKFQFAQRCMQQEQWEIKDWFASKKSKDLIKAIKAKADLPWSKVTLADCDYLA